MEKVKSKDRHLEWGWGQTRSAPASTSLFPSAHLSFSFDDHPRHTNICLRRTVIVRNTILKALSRQRYELFNMPELPILPHRVNDSFKRQAYGKCSLSGIKSVSIYQSR
jgi:hypothetical protein